MTEQLSFLEKVVKPLRINDGSGYTVTRISGTLILLTILVWALVKYWSGDHPRPQPIPEVAVVTLMPERVTITNRLPGRTSPFLVSDIRPQVNGLIERRLFTEGAQVESGQVLYKIEPAPFQAALDNAQASLARAEAALYATELKTARYRKVLADKAISQQDYDDAVAVLKQARAEVEFWKASTRTAQINLGYTDVKAPISGRIGRSSVTDGALVTAYQQLVLATVQQLDPIYVDVPQSTAEMLRLKQRMQQGRLKQNGESLDKVRLYLEDGSEYPLEGVLQFKDVTVDISTGSVTLRVIFPNPESLLLPGMFVRAEIREGINDRAILIPQEAVLRTPKGEPFVYVVDAEDKVQERMLRLDRALGNKWLVAEGLEVGTRIVVEGVQKVRPGSPVRIASLKDRELNPIETTISK